VGDLIILRASVTAAFHTSLEVEVEVFTEKLLTGERRRTSLAHLTFVALAIDGRRASVPPLRLDTDADRQKAREADARRAARLAAKRTPD
jgi:acyl-CoA hydrolase